MALAYELENPFSLMNALSYRANFHRLRRELDDVEEMWNASRHIAAEHGFAPSKAAGVIRQGIELMRQGQLESGRTLVQEGFTALRATGVAIRFPLYCIQLAEVYKNWGQDQEGLSVIAETLDHVQHTDERWHEAELHRLKGDLLLQQSSDNQTEADESFHNALDIARQQQAKSWELRAATSLARLCQQQGKLQDAYDLLSPVYGWFTEGFDTADLQDAKALLDKLTEQTRKTETSMPGG